MNTQPAESIYQGFEQGPIRPPSEAHSLLIRVTRNCPWNRCTFCPVYKGSEFSIRPVAHVKRDIDAVHQQVEKLRRLENEPARLTQAGLLDSPPEDRPALNAAFHWVAGGLDSVFLQDANSLIVKPADLIDILTHLKRRFPWIKRITTYARSHTIARIRDEHLRAFQDAGLNRIHIGLESGSDQVLERVRKGVTKAIHIKAGLKVKRSGMELSEYVMPGLGGRALSRVHALETADALNQINPDFIRLRTLAIPDTVQGFKDAGNLRFEKCSDHMIVEEILLLIENLNGIASVVKSDHILNLFEEVDGRLPEDKSKITRPLRDFLALAPRQQMQFQLGRRLGLFSRLDDMQSRHRLARVEEACRRLGVTPETIDDVTDQLMKHFI